MLSKVMRLWRLRCKLRRTAKCSPSDFRGNDLLYRDFRNDELDDEGILDTNTLRLPDMSCNWDKFSQPEDILHRARGSLSNGCYSINVETVRYKNFATPCHDPICCEQPHNYSHVEVRELYDGEETTFEPPKKRKKRRKALRAEWKTKIIENHKVIFDAT